MEEADTATLKERGLRARKADLILARSAVPCPEFDIEAEALFNDPLRVIVGTTSPWTRRRLVRLSDLASEPWAIPPYDSVVGALIREAFEGSGVELPDPAVATISIPLNMKLLSAGRHISIMPNSLIYLRGKELGLKALPIVLPIDRAQWQY